jgi:hypothetical protein
MLLNKINQLKMRSKVTRKLGNKEYNLPFFHQLGISSIPTIKINLIKTPVR